MTDNDNVLKNRDQLQTALTSQAYIADSALVSSLFLASQLEKPLLIEGEAGVGKTEIAKCIADASGRQLIRLQCYEGQDAQQALYDWDYQKQLLSIQAHKELNPDKVNESLYTKDYLLERPLLRAIASEKPVVLLIDEIDRADQEFEAFLLELLSDFQISIPELGTYTARTKPLVILTSNGVRELSDALRRRCLYHYIDYPDGNTERKIVQARLPGMDEALAKQVVYFVQLMRTKGLRKTPGVAESIDWASALMAVGVNDLYANPQLSESTLSCLIKTHSDIERVKELGIGFDEELSIASDSASSSSDSSDSGNNNPAAYPPSNVKH